MTDTATTDLTESETKKPVKEIPVIQDQGFFTHTTGDTYDGYFEAKKKDKIAKMHGPGVYTTAEGDIYIGTWENDRLGANEEVTIRFTDTTRYEGTIKDWCYSGFGTYTFPDETVLQCNFLENCPVGVLTLLDPNRHIWLGKPENGFGWFEPVNHYYYLLERSRESTRHHRRRKVEIEAKSTMDATKSKIKATKSTIGAAKSTIGVAKSTIAAAKSTIGPAKSRKLA